MTPTRYGGHAPPFPWWGEDWAGGERERARERGREGEGEREIERAYKDLLFLDSNQVNPGP